MNVSQFLQAFRSQGIPVHLIFEMAGGYGLVVDFVSSVNGLYDCLIEAVPDKGDDDGPLSEYHFRCTIPSTTPVSALPAICEHHVASVCRVDASQLPDLLRNAYCKGLFETEQLIEWEDLSMVLPMSAVERADTSSLEV